MERRAPSGDDTQIGSVDRSAGLLGPPAGLLDPSAGVPPSPNSPTAPQLPDPELVMTSCANCGARMLDRKCKLICACGYFLSCSDYY